MYMTLWPRSPCEKMACDRPYSTICFDSPAESRNACALKAGIRLAISREYAGEARNTCAQRHTRRDALDADHATSRWRRTCAVRGRGRLRVKTIRAPTESCPFLLPPREP